MQTVIILLQEQKRKTPEGFDLPIVISKMLTRVAESTVREFTRQLLTRVLGKYSGVLRRKLNAQHLLNYSNTEWASFHPRGWSVLMRSINSRLRSLGSGIPGPEETSAGFSMWVRKGSLESTDWRKCIGNKDNPDTAHFVIKKGTQNCTQGFTTENRKLWKAGDWGCPLIFRIFWAFLFGFCMPADVAACNFFMQGRFQQEEPRYWGYISWRKTKKKTFFVTDFLFFSFQILKLAFLLAVLQTFSPGVLAGKGILGMYTCLNDLSLSRESLFHF